MRHTATVRSNLPTLIAAKAKLEGRSDPITQTEIVLETRLSPGTVGSWMRGEQTRFDGHVIAALCKYLDCKIEDLLEIVDPGKTVVGKPDSAEH